MLTFSKPIKTEAVNRWHKLGRNLISGDLIE